MIGHFERRKRAVERSQATDETVRMLSEEAEVAGDLENVQR